MEDANFCSWYRCLGHISTEHTPTWSDSAPCKLSGIQYQLRPMNYTCSEWRFVSKLADFNCTGGGGGGRGGWGRGGGFPSGLTIFFIGVALIESREQLHIIFCFNVSARYPSKHISCTLLQFQHKAKPPVSQPLYHAHRPHWESASKMASESFTLSQHSLYSTLTLHCPCFYSRIQIKQQWVINFILNIHRLWTWGSFHAFDLERR